jgi:hypothetical protein
MLTLRNVLLLETRWGVREFELWQGDITELPGPIGLVAVSTFPGCYPKATNVIGALWHAHGIDVEALAQEPELDLRGALHGWVSQPLDSGPFRRMVCVEFGAASPLRANYENLFAIIAAFETKGGKKIQLDSLALPMLGAGDQGFSPDEVMNTLLEVVTENLETLRTVRRVAFVGHRAEHAHALSEAMDRLLGRIRLVLPHGNVADTVRAQLRELVDRLASHEGYAMLARDLGAFFDDDVRSYQLGVLGRRVVEAMVGHFLNADAPRPVKGTDLAGNIEALRKIGTAEWIVSYMHLMRVFGNESAHEKGKDTHRRDPPTLEADDLEVLLVCLRRLLEYWTARLSKGSLAPDAPA